MATSTTGAAAPSPQQIRPRIVEQVRHMARVPLMPAYGPRLMEMARASIDDVDVSELDRLINQEPTLASRLLRRANSPYYGAVQSIATVRQAIMTVGLQDTLGLLLATSMLDRYSEKSDMRNLDAKQFKLHSIAVGAAARAAFTFAGVPMLSPAEISLGGLLHDIGKNVFIGQFPELYDECVEIVRKENRPLTEVETERCGIAHDEVGAMLAEEWKLPTFFVESARWHHAPDSASDSYVEGVRLVRWADRLARSVGMGESGNRPPGMSSAGSDDDALEQKLAGKAPQIEDAVEQHLRAIGADEALPEEGERPPEKAPRHRGSADRAVRREAPKPSSLWGRLRGLFK